MVEREALPADKQRTSKRSAETAERLLEGVITSLQTHGAAGTSARTVARAADVNQALIFYHFGDMEGLLAAACQRSTQRLVARYHDRLASVTSLRELLDVGWQIHRTERAQGNVTVLAQLLAAGQTNPALAKVTADGLDVWVAQIETVLTRLLSDSPLATLIDSAGTSRAVAAAFIGLELYEGVDPVGGASAFQALDQLGVILDLVDELGPVARRVLRSRVRRAHP